MATRKNPQAPGSGPNRILRILQLIAASESPLTAAEVAQHSGLHRTTVYRIFDDLEQGGWIQEIPTEGTSSRSRHFDLGPQALGLAVLINAKHRPEDRLVPVIQKLAQGVNETAHCGMLDGTSVIHVAAAVPAEGLHLAMRSGVAVPAHATALGKALLATLSADEVIRRYRDESLPTRTAQTIATRTDLLAELETTRRRGYSVEANESSDGIKCVGAPVFGPSGSASFAISVTSTPLHLDQAREGAVARAVQSAAAEATVAFGGTPAPPWAASAELLESGASS